MGSVLTEKLVKKSYKVITLDPLIYSDTPSAPKKNKNIINYVGLTEDNYMLNKIFDDHRINSVIHLSGISNDPTAILNPELTKKSNIIATEKLVKISKKHKVKNFLFASSCSVYGFTGKHKLIKEGSKTNPISEYAKSKIVGEKIALKAKSRNFIVNCLRKGTLYGPSPRMRFDLVLNTMVGSALQDKKIVINGGDQWRPFLHVEDAADAYIRLIENKNPRINGHIFNVGSNTENYQIKELAERIKQYIPDSRIKFSNNFDNRSYRVNFDKINNLLNWHPKKEIDDGIKSIMKLFKKGIVKNYRDINYYNIRRLISHLNI